MEVNINDVVDDQFSRAVQIVQSLPKTGPIQTGYEEKLAMYSLFKQATQGNVKTPRPPMWDMLGRAKWDAWAKHKDLSAFEAKRKYIDELLHILRKYSDKTVARDLVRELEAYTEDPSESNAEDNLSESHDSSSSSSSRSASPSQNYKRVSRSLELQAQRQKLEQEGHNYSESDQDLESDADAEGEGRDEFMEKLRTGAPVRPSAAPSIAQSHTQSLLGRPQSSLSTHRYRTPMGGSLVMSPPPPLPVGNAQYTTYASQIPPIQQQRSSLSTYGPNLAQNQPSGVYVQPQSVHHSWGSYSPLPRPDSVHQMMPGSLPNESTHSFNAVPIVQPMPTYETPSAFQGPSPPLRGTISTPSAIQSSAYNGLGTSGASTQHPYPPNMYPGHPAYRGPPSADSHGQPLSSIPGIGGVAGSRTPLERAMESVQAHLAALQERVEIIEGRVGVGMGSPTSSVSRSPRNSGYFTKHGSGLGNGGGEGYPSSWSLYRWALELDEEYFDWEHMGLWSTILAPLARVTKFLFRVVAFLVSRRQRTGGNNGSGRGGGLSPGLLILRRLLLDVSFILCAAFVGRRIWVRSGLRRKEVIHALAGVWHAISGQATSRVLVDRGV